MYAVVTTLTFSDRSAAEAEISEIVSRVSGMPGFSGGYWVALGADHGISVLAFDSQAAAQALVTLAETAPYASVTPEAIQLGRSLGAGGWMTDPARIRELTLGRLIDERPGVHP